jgi:hypothetical protein
VKSLTILALVTAQALAAPQPAFAADLQPDLGVKGTTRMGAFAGARVSVPLGSKRQAVRATLTAAPTLHSLQSSGEQRMRIGQGLELGVDGKQTRFDLAGRPVAGLVQGQSGPEGERRNLSTIGAVAIGVGVLLVGLYFLAESCRKGEICGSE